MNEQENWKVTYNHQGQFPGINVLNSDNLFVCHVGYEGPWSPKYARLIAAAPDLLGACQSAFRSFDADLKPNLARKLEQAIIKATR